MKQPRLLLVEDEANLAFTLEYNLRAEGYLVDVAPTLADAATRLGRESYEVLVLDVMLPDGSGFDLCRQLRARGNRTPILMLTALGTSDDVVGGLDAGADDYVTKPFDLTELVGRITALRRRRAWDREATPVPAAKLFRFGPFTVDLARREVTRKGVLGTGPGEQVPLTDLELELLAYFVQRPGEVVTRAQLLEDVWQLPRTTHTRTVDNFLVRLRRLFEQDPAAPKHFMTVHGTGYRFCP